MQKGIGGLIYDGSCKVNETNDMLNGNSDTFITQKRRKQMTSYQNLHMFTYQCKTYK